jgi:hypothetical protein
VTTITRAAIPHMVTASTNHSWSITLRLSTVIGSKPAITWDVGTAWATPHEPVIAAAT